MSHRPATCVAVTALALTALAGCSSDDGGADAKQGTTTTTSTVSASTAGATQALTASQMWAKATTSGMRMTAVFGQLRNTSDRPVVVTAVRTSASDRAEIHEMAMVNGSMVMRPKPGGLTIAPGATVTLKPGGDHLMLMNLARPVKAGDTVAVTLTTKDSGSVRFNATAKPFSGANETYHASPSS